MKSKELKSKAFEYVLNKERGLKDSAMPHDAIMAIVNDSIDGFVDAIKECLLRGEEAKIHTLCTLGTEMTKCGVKKPYNRVRFKASKILKNAINAEME